MASPLLGAVAHWAGYTTMFSTSAIGLLLAAAVFWWRPDDSRQQSEFDDQL